MTPGEEVEQPLDLDAVADVRRIDPAPQLVVLREVAGIVGARAVDLRRTRHHELAHAGRRGRVHDVQRPDHLELVGLHRIDPALVDDVVAESGFILEARSDLLAHPEDDHTKRVFDPTLRGDTDRFILRLRKPE